MKTNKLTACSLRVGIAAVALALCASAFAGSSKTASQKARAARHTHTYCYVQLSNTSFPQPCDRLVGLPSTSTPMDIIGEIPVVRVTVRD